MGSQTFHGVSVLWCVMQCLGAMLICLWGHVAGGPVSTSLMLKAEPREQQLRFVCPRSAFVKTMGQNNHHSQSLQIWKQSPCAKEGGRINLAIMITSEGEARVSGDLINQTEACAQWVDKNRTEAAGSWSRDETLTLTLRVYANQGVKALGIYGCSYHGQELTADSAPNNRNRYVNVTGDKEYYSSNPPGGFQIRVTQNFDYCFKRLGKRGCCFKDSDIKHSTSDEIDALVEKSPGYTDLRDDDASNTFTDFCHGTLHFNRHEAAGTANTANDTMHPPQPAYLHLNAELVYECHKYETNTWICNPLKDNSLHPGFIAAIVASLLVLAGIVATIWVIRKRKWLCDKCRSISVKCPPASTNDNQPNEGTPKSESTSLLQLVGTVTKTDAGRIQGDTETTGLVVELHQEQKTLEESDRKPDSKPEDDENTDNGNNDVVQSVPANINMRGLTWINDDNDDHSVRQSGY